MEKIIRVAVDFNGGTQEERESWLASYITEGAEPIWQGDRVIVGWEQTTLRERLNQKTVKVAELEAELALLEAYKAHLTQLKTLLGILPSSVGR